MSLQPSYLASMSVDERAASVVLAMKTAGNLPEVHAKGFLQFLAISRPILRNWGVKRDDYGRIWEMIEWAMKQPGSFLAYCQRMDDAKRIRVQ